MSALTITASCVFAPAWWLTAVREKKPATGKPEEKAAERLASLRALSSALESILYFSFAATALSTEIDSTKPTNATVRAAGNSARAASGSRAGTERAGNPPGTSPTTATPRGWRPSR